MEITLHLHHAPDGTVLARQYIDESETGLTGTRNPTGKPDPITMHDYLAWLNEDPARREQAGYAEIHQFPDDAQPMSRWERVVAHADHPQASDAFKSLKLTGK